MLPDVYVCNLSPQGEECTYSFHAFFLFGDAVIFFWNITWLLLVCNWNIISKQITLWTLGALLEISVKFSSTSDAKAIWFNSAGLTFRKVW